MFRLASVIFGSSRAYVIDKRDANNEHSSVYEIYEMSFEKEEEVKGEMWKLNKRRERSTSCGITCLPSVRSSLCYVQLEPDIIFCVTKNMCSKFFYLFFSTKTEKLY